jgi:hypothetical protein
MFRKEKNKNVYITLFDLLHTTIFILWFMKKVLGKKTGAQNIVKEIKQYQEK